MGPIERMSCVVAKIVDCAVLRATNLTARRVFSHRALSNKVNKLEKQKRRDREELASKSKELKNELEAARERVTRLEEAVRGSRASQGSKRRTVEKGSSSRGRESPESDGSPEVQSPTQKKKK